MICTDCNIDKTSNEFYVRKSGASRTQCKSCISNKNKQAVTIRRQKVKRLLVEHFGNKCVDCGYEGPAFMFDFDHKDPSIKEFSIASKASYSYQSLLAEATKCDLVCARCHRFRTHVQRCNGCELCK